MQSLLCRLRHVSAEIKSQDAVYVLAYSVIMLNTDLHNPQVRVSQHICVAHSFCPQPLAQKRMTIEDYQRNLRGVNDGSDFSPEYLVRGMVNVSGRYCSRPS